MGSARAHTPGPNGEWHDLVDHSIAVAELASRFAAPFGAGELAHVLGLWHDLGKVNPDFQAYLQAQVDGKHANKTRHAIWSGALAYHLFHHLGQDAERWKELSVPMAGHHSGMEHPGRLAQSVSEFLGSQKDSLKRMRSFLKQLPTPPDATFPVPPSDRRDLFIRMVFSALVDADYLDTERHFEPGRARARGDWTRPSDLWPIFRSNQLRMMWGGRGDSPVNRIRRQIYRDCLRAAKMPPGVFRLTVPTGGGKTRSGLAFALHHALEHRQHGFRRVIVALPYTSIIDQTANEYRGIFGDRFVLEHHSQVDWPDTEEQDEEHIRHRLATENWDHPLIVTTTVQLFESLFANKPGRCRKLHNITRSILILDEVQTLPPELLRPTLNVLRALLDGFGLTLVLSTATQPTFDRTPYLKAFDGLRTEDIVPDPQRFFLNEDMKRVEYQPVRHLANLLDLADELAESGAPQYLVVLNTRKHALALYAELLQRRIDGLYHLSTMLCGAHRKRVLADIRRRLDPANAQPVRLISTQVVEAGVDLDFPVVYRAMGPLDRIVQAAGRCNREGRLKDEQGRSQRGKVVVFDWPDNASPPGAYEIGLGDAKTLLQRNEPDRLQDPSFHAEYFQCLFRDVNLDKREIQPYRGDLDFPEVARLYRLIEDTVPVAVPKYDGGEGERRMREHLKAPSRDTWRQLMPYVVNLCQRDVIRLQDWLEEVSDNLFRWIGQYDDKTHRGLVEAVRDPADLVV